MRFIAYGVIEPLVHIPPNELQRRHAADSPAIGLPERAVHRPPRFRVRACVVCPDATDNLIDPCLSEVVGEHPALTHFHTHARVRVDHAPLVWPGASHVVCMAPEVRELPFVASDHEQRRSGADLLLPASARTPVVLPQAK